MTQPTSVETIWHEFGDQLRRRARTRLRQYGLVGQAESMDICNDVMADLARRESSQTLAPADAVAYVMRAIDNQVLDTFRTLARRCRDFRRNEGTPVDELRMQAAERTPSQVALQREVLQKIQEMLGPAESVAVTMMLENRSWAEIGEHLEMTPDAARMRVRRAIERVKREMGPAEQTP